MSNNTIIKLSFERKALLYDISNVCYVEADNMGDEPTLSHHVFDVAEEGNVDRVTRVMNLAFAEVTELLYPFSKSEVEKSSANNLLTAPSAYELQLSLPANFSSSSVQLLRHSIHEYIVCSAVSDWLGIVKPSSAPNWGAKVVLLKNTIRDCMHNRRSFLRRRMQPF